MDKIHVDAPNAREAFARWLGRGDAIGVFVNQALDSSLRGQHVFIPLQADEAGPERLGQMRAPDGSYGAGWRYRLVAIERDLGAFEFVDDQAALSLQPSIKHKRRRRL